jgi:2-dehydro-3-deoxyphosphogluconate aldolase/(4S)-4-hydroxy-2-oxoglutarate aldolase
MSMQVPDRRHVDSSGTAISVPPEADPIADVLALVTASHIVPVLVIEDEVSAAPLGRALAAGGLPVAEVTLRTAASLPAIAALAESADVLVGAGTVLTAHQVDQAVAAGARFIVSPGLSRAVVKRCAERGVPVVPGAVTATELQAALELGLNTVKFFPAATSGGAASLRALAAPFKSMRFVPTGGIGPETLADFLALPAVVAVGGSWMAPAELVAKGDFTAITRLTADAVTRARHLRGAARGVDGT